MSLMSDFEAVWSRIKDLAGGTFHTKTGKPFTYECSASAVRLRNTNRAISRGDFAKAVSRFPPSGPGNIQDLQGPSYIYAILTDPRVFRSALSTPGKLGRRGERLQRAVPVIEEAAPILGDSWRVSPRRDVAEPHLGTSVASAELLSLKFAPYRLFFRTGVVSMPEGVGCEWDTIGQVPAGPGLYAFTVHAGSGDWVQVMYAGLTTHLWMVTKGTMPGGIARGGQRYGRPRHAGATRKRVNVEICRACAAGV